MTRAVQYAFCVAMVLAGACARADAGAAIEDGVAPRWTLAAEPELRLGEGDGEHSLHRVMGAVRLADGRIAVANAGSQQVRVFGADGAWQADLGGAGRGPGEFEAPTWIGLHRDTLLVWDILAQRLSRFAPDGTFASSTTVGGDVGHFPRMVGAYGDGSFLLATDRATAGGIVGAVRDSVILLRFAAKGDLLDTVAVVPGSERFASVSPDGRRFKVEDLPFGRRTVMALHDDVLHLGTGEDARVRTVAVDGAVRTLLTVPGTPPAVGAADVEEYWAKLVTTGGGADAGDRKPTEGMPYPDRLPSYGALHVDAAGRVWLAEARLPREWDEPAIWDVFSPGGEPLASIALPPRSLVLQIGGRLDPAAGDGRGPARNRIALSFHPCTLTLLFPIEAYP